MIANNHSGSVNISIWPSAFSLAAAAHAGQLQKESEVPFIAHPCRVAMLIARDFECTDDAVLAAAVLHDVLEKTAITSEELKDHVGTDIAGWVEWLSKGVRGPESEYWQLLTSAPWQAKLIKIADALDHLDCHLSEIHHRIDSARKALEIADLDATRLSIAYSRLSLALDAAIARKSAAEAIGTVEPSGVGPGTAGDSI